MCMVNQLLWFLSLSFDTQGVSGIILKNTLNQNWDKPTEYILCSYSEAAYCVYKLL